MITSQEDLAKGSLEQTNKWMFLLLHAETEMKKLTIVSATVSLWDAPTVPRRREQSYFG